MSAGDVSLDQIVPQICLQCGAWFGADLRVPTNYECPACGFNNKQFVEFYSLCHKLAEDFGSIPDEDSREKPISFDLQSVLGTDTLALLSAFALGLLANASYDAVKTWVGSRAREFLKKYRPRYDYNQAVEVLFDYTIEHVDKIQRLKASDSSVSILFGDRISELKQRIEDSVARPSSDDAKQGSPGAQS